MNKQITTFALCVFALTVLAERQPFERYQSIVDRQMFGPLPPGFDPTKSPAEVQKTTAASQKELTKEQEKVKSAIRFSVINVTPEGETAIGFTDNSDPKTPVHYYLKVGEESNGWLVKEADPAAASMTIAKDGVEVSLTLGGDSAQKQDATQRTSGAGGVGGASRIGGGLHSRGGFLGGGGMGGTLRAKRLLQRQQREQEQNAQRQQEQAQREAEREAKQEEEKQQREAERAEQRQQLQAIQEELKRVREQKAAAAEKTEPENGEAE